MCDYGLGDPQTWRVLRRAPTAKETLVFASAVTLDRVFNHSNELQPQGRGVDLHPADLGVDTLHLRERGSGQQVSGRGAAGRRGRFHLLILPHSLSLLKWETTPRGLKANPPDDRPAPC